MAGRRAKPISLHLHDGNKRHLTKAEIEHRLENEIKIGSNVLLPTKMVKRDKEAHKKWKEVVKLFEDVELASESDRGIIERYSLEYSHYYRMQKARNEVIEKGKKDGWDNVKVFQYINKLNIDDRMNKKLDILLKMEDRLLLNPLAKTRSVPKKPSEEDEDPLSKTGF